MAINNINAQIGLLVNKSSVNAVVNNVTTIKEQVLSVGPVFAQFQKKIESLGDVAKWASVGVGAEKAFGGIKSIIDSVTNSFKKQFSFAQSYASIGDKIAKTSKMLGLTVDEYQVFSSAAKHSGMSVEELDSAFKKFNVTLGKARVGDKESIKKISSLLPKKAKLSDYKDVSSVIAAVADGYMKLQSAEQKAFVSQELFGKSGQKMSELFKDGSEGLFQAYKEFKESKSGFDDDGVKNAELFNDELQKTQEIVDSLKIAAAQELFPIITDMFKTVQKFVKDNRAELIPVVKELFAHSTKFVKAVLPLSLVILKAIVKILDLFGAKIFVIIGGILSMIPAFIQILTGLVMMAPLWGKIAAAVVKTAPFWIKIGSVLKLIAFGAIGMVAIKIAIAVAAALSLYKIFTEIHKNWRMFSDYIEEKLQTATGVAYTLWGYLRVFVGHLEMAYRFIGLIFLDWKGWSEFVTKDLVNVNYFVHLIGDCLAGVMYGIYEAFNWVMEKFEKIGEYLGKFKSFFGLGDVNVNVNGSSGHQATLAASAAQAISESHTTVTNRFAVDFSNVPRGTKITPPPKGDFDWSRGYMLGGV